MKIAGKPWLEGVDTTFLQHYCCMMIPDLVMLAGSPWPVLPAGIHPAGLVEVGTAFAINPRRRELFEGILDGGSRLKRAQCQTLYLDGSFVSGKPSPGDYDACWDPAGVDVNLLDPIFQEFTNLRAAQKAALKGEYFPSSMICTDVGRSFLDFMQIDRFTGNAKGIVSISLQQDPALL